jgi:hypothetical protein
MTARSIYDRTIYIWPPDLYIRARSIYKRRIYIWTRGLYIRARSIYNRTIYIYPHDLYMTARFIYTRTIYIYPHDLYIRVCACACAYPCVCVCIHTSERYDEVVQILNADIDPFADKLTTHEIRARVVGTRTRMLLPRFRRWTELSEARAKQAFEHAKGACIGSTSSL